MINKKDNRFYNYIYLDPTKPMEYKIKGLDIILKYEPFYVGKGTGGRMNQHMYNNKNNCKFMKCKIKSLTDNNIVPIKYKLIEGITNKESCENEKYLIKIIGRRDLGLGPLVNLTNGGEEGCGRIISIEQREKLRQKFKDIPLSEEHKKKIGESNKGKKISEATILGKKKRLENLIKKVKVKKERFYRPIKMLDINDNLLQTFKSFIEASEKTNYKKYTIRNQCEKLGKCRYEQLKFRYND